MTINYQIHHCLLYPNSVLHGVIDNTILCVGKSWRGKTLVNADLNQLEGDILVNELCV